MIDCKYKVIIHLCLKLPCNIPRLVFFHLFRCSKNQMPLENQHGMCAVNHSRGSSLVFQSQKTVLSSSSFFLDSTQFIALFTHPVRRVVFTHNHKTQDTKFGSLGEDHPRCTGDPGPYPSPSELSREHIYYRNEIHMKCQYQS